MRMQMLLKPSLQHLVQDLRFRLPLQRVQQPAMDAVDFNSADEQQAMASGLSGPPSFDPKALTGVAPGMGGVPPGMGSDAA